MGELLEYLKERYMGSKNSEARDLMQRQKVKNAILQACETHIKEPEDTFTFEILPSDLPYATEVVDEEAISSKYQITQTSATLFVAKLKVIEL